MILDLTSIVKKLNIAKNGFIMKFIPPKFVDVNRINDDIFSYFRSYFNVSNPHDAGIISIQASSTSSPGSDERTDVPTLIKDDT